MEETVRLERITPGNVEAACGVAVRADQERFVAPVVKSLAEAYAHVEIAWPRLIVDGDRAVGFVMAAFDPGNPVEAFRCGIWRLNIADGGQRRGYGRFAVDAVAAETRRRGAERMTVLWVPGEGGPEGFYLRLGFRPTGQVMEGEVVGALRL